MTTQERKIKTIMYVNFLAIKKTIDRNGRYPIVLVVPGIGEFHIGTKATEKKLRKRRYKKYRKSVRKKGKEAIETTTNLEYLFSNRNSSVLGHIIYKNKKQHEHN